MALNTSRLTLPYPQETDTCDPPYYFAALAARLDAISIYWSAGVLASRPAFGNPGFVYFATDTLLLYYDTGSAWININPPVSTADLSAIATTNPTAANVSLNGHKVTNAANGTAGNDYATLSQIPTVFAPGTSLETFIGATVFLPSGTPTQIATLTLPVGKWLVEARVQAGPGNSNIMVVDLWIGPNSASVAGAYAGVSVTTGANTVSPACAVIIKVVTVGASTPIYLNGESAYGYGSAALYQSEQYGVPNVTGITAVQLA